MPNCYDFEDLPSFKKFDEYKILDRKQIEKYFIKQIDQYGFPGFQNLSTLPRISKYITTTFINAQNDYLLKICSYFLKIMPARYLIRLDDALPTMNAEKWEIVENLLDQHGIKPMVAVIPDNSDETMEFDDVDLLFWERVKKWKAKGWSIGLHGYNHLYHEIDRKDSLVPFHNRSEFVGLNFEMQKEKA